VSWLTASDWVWDGTADPYRSYSSAEHLTDTIHAPASGEAGPRYEVYAVLLGSSHCAQFPQWRYAANPLVGGNPQLPAH